MPVLVKMYKQFLTNYRKDVKRNWVAERLIDENENVYTRDYLSCEMFVPATHQMELIVLQIAKLFFNGDLKHVKSFEFKKSRLVLFPIQNEK